MVVGKCEGRVTIHTDLMRRNSPDELPWHSMKFCGIRNVTSEYQLGTLPTYTYYIKDKIVQ
jgi:hypothetical protein